MLTEFSVAGENQTDERIECTESVTINAVTYYRGYLKYLPNNNMSGDSDPDFGIWTAVSKGGTRFDVLTGYVSGQSGSGGLPTIATEIGVDLTNGKVYALSSQTVYARYQGHGPIRHFNNDIGIDVNYYLSDGVAYDVLKITPAQYKQILHIEVDIYGDQALDEMSGDCTFTVKNAESSGDEEDFIIDKSGLRYQSFTLSDIIKATPGGLLIVSTANGKGLANFRVWFRGP